MTEDTSKPPSLHSNICALRVNGRLRVKRLSSWPREYEQQPFPEHATVVLWRKECGLFFYGPGELNKSGTFFLCALAYQFSVIKMSSISPLNIAMPMLCRVFQAVSSRLNNVHFPEERAIPACHDFDQF